MLTALITVVSIKMCMVPNVGDFKEHFIYDLASSSSDFLAERDSALI